MISFLNEEMEPLVQFLSPFLVMPFLSTRFPHLPKLLNSLGRDCLLWKRIRLLNGAKHQIRAPLLFIPSCVWLFHHHGLSDSVPAPDSVWTWSVFLMFLFYFILFLCVKLSSCCTLFFWFRLVVDRMEFLFFYVTMTMHFILLLKS